MQAPLKEIEDFPPARVVALLNIHLPLKSSACQESKARLTFQEKIILHMIYLQDSKITVQDS
jgi:hypothetical protein